ncbi:hypothetical protein VTO42DRAFT_6568 [Malbranchea cinnamomea]
MRGLLPALQGPADVPGGLCWSRGCTQDRRARWVSPLGWSLDRPSSLPSCSPRSSCSPVQSDCFLTPFCVIFSHLFSLPSRLLILSSFLSPAESSSSLSPPLFSPTF